MTRARVLQEVRRMRFEELYGRRQRRELTMAEAAEMLGITERTFRRWSGRFEAEGVEGLQDRRRGRPSAAAVPVGPARRVGPGPLSGRAVRGTAQFRRGPAGMVVRGGRSF